MAQSSRRTLWAALLLVLSGVPARAQTTPVWPEVDAYVKVNDAVRVFLLATTVQENHESTEGEFGANIDWSLKQIRRKKPVLVFRLDESKNRRLLVRAGYRYLPSYTGGPSEHRGVLEATPRFPLMGLLGDVLVSDRNRLDFRVIDGQYSWRYRNRLSAEKEFSIRRVRLNPYTRFEVYYDSRFAEWTRTELMIGSSFPITSHWELEGYFDVQNDTSGSSDRRTKAVGAVVSFYL